MRYVIIGNSAAAAGCVEGIRSADASGEITIISREPHHLYSRPLISYYLEGKTDLKKMRYRPENFYQVNGVKTVLGAEASRIDPAEKQVLLADGRAIPYDRLMVATGSVPFVPPMDGLDSVTARTGFMSLDEALWLEKNTDANSSVLIVGAGLIGLKCAEGIAHRVRSVAVVEMAPRVMPAVLDAECAAIIQAKMEEHGVRFYLNDSVAHFEPNEATLKSGAKLPFDALVLAVGVRPNVGLIRDAGGEVGRAVKVDDAMRTTIPDVYAAGDLTLSHDVSDGGAEKVLALWPNAYMQGYAGGRAMAGVEAKYDRACPMNAGGFFGLHMVGAGTAAGEAVVSRTPGGIKKMFVRGDYLAGYVLIGDVERAGIYTALIRDQTPLSSIDFELVKERPQLMAFSSRARAKMLGGIKA